MVLNVLHSKKHIDMQVTLITLQKYHSQTYQTLTKS